MALVQRKIDVTITLGSGDFGEGPAGSNVAKMTGLRVAAVINKGGLPSADMAEVRIWGATRSVMNQASRLGKPISLPRENTLTLEVGDDNGNMELLFSGTIIGSYVDFTDLPNTCLACTCISNWVESAKPVPALSFTGPTDVAVVMAQIAASMGKNLKNSGVSGVILNTPYYPGTAMDQMKAAAQAANINADANDPSFLEIWPKGASRGDSKPSISADTGLIGYPTYSDYGIALRALYQPGFVLNGLFDLKSDIDPVNGTWQVVALTYELESEEPSGKWELRLTAGRPTSAGGAI